MARRPKILLVDIETAPIQAWVWSLWQDNAAGVIRDTYLLTFAYKWLGHPGVSARGLPDYLGYREDPTNDRQLATDLWKLFDEADVVVAHNGNRFDIPKAMARFVVHGLKPPSPFKQVDTLQIAKRRFRFDSNKLDNLARYLEVGRKIKHTGFALWEECMAGDMAAWRAMIRYNKHDVRLLELVYNKLKAWDTAHPRLDKYGLGGVCPTCQSDAIQARGWSVAKTRKTRRLHCQECGHWFAGEVIKT